MAVPNVGQLVASTLANYRSTFTDNVMQGNVVFYKLKEKGFWTVTDGGTEIEERLEYGSIPMQYYDGGFEPWNLTPAEIMDVAKFQWKYAVTPVVIKGSDARKNSGDAKIKDLVKGLVKNAERSMRDSIASDLYGDGTGSGGKAIDGLKSILHDDPTTSSLIGGINQSTNSWWRNRVTDYSSDLSISSITSANVVQGFNHLYQQCRRGAEKPDLGILCEDWFRLYEEYLQDKVRFTDQKMADAGFPSLKYKNMDMIDDPGMPMTDDRAYFLNTDYIRFRVHPDANFTTEDARKPDNQDGWVVPILLMGNLTVTNRRNQGVLKA